MLLLLLTKILIKSSINSAYAEISRRIRNAHLQQSNNGLPRFLGNSKPSRRVCIKVGLQAVRSKRGVAAASALPCRSGPGRGARGPGDAMGVAEGHPGRVGATLAGGRKGRWRVRAARAARCPGEGRSRWKKPPRPGGKQKLVVSPRKHSPLLGSGPRPALIWKTRVSPPRGAGSPAEKPALGPRGRGLGRRGARRTARGSGGPRRRRRAQGRESPTRGARPSGRQLLRGTGPNFGPSGPRRGTPRAAGTLAPAAAARRALGRGGCRAGPRRPSGPRPRDAGRLASARGLRPTSPSAASGLALTWLPGRARAAAGGAEARARRGQGRRPGVERTAARAAPTLPPESGVEHSASPPRANEEDSRDNSTTYLRARNGGASLPAPLLRLAGRRGVGKRSGLPGLHPRGFRPPRQPPQPRMEELSGERTSPAARRGEREACLWTSR